MKYIEIKVPILLRRDFKQWWFIKKNSIINYMY